MGKEAGYDGHTIRVFRPIDMLPTMYMCYSKVLQQLAGQAVHTKHGPQYGHHVTGRQAHEVVPILRRMVEQANEWRIPLFVMNFDVAAAFDYVSHLLVINAMEALEVLRCWCGSVDQRIQGLRNVYQARRHTDAGSMPYTFDAAK